MTSFLQNLIDGLGAGSTYALMAVGVSLLFGVMHLVNFAHGEMLTVSAYATYYLSTKGIGWWVAVPTALIVSMAVSVLIELLAFRRVRGASAFTLLLTSFGVEILSHAIWRIGVSSKPKPFPAPEWTYKAFDLGPLRVEYWDTISIITAVVTFAGTALILKRTMFGVAMRAAAEDFDAARLMGVKANRVISGAFAFAGLLAGISAALQLMRLGQAEPTMGAQPLLKAVVAAIIGGLGSLPGAVVGGLALGITEVYFRDWLPDDLAGLTDGLVFAAIAVLFVARPQGLFNVSTAERV